jgi:ElaB/YqjD/DUF883 family membrane-anchored ribosome-binding protein
MATRSDEPLTVHGGLEGDHALEAERIREDIAETRNHMARTAAAIEERLSPANIKAQVSGVKSHLLEEIKDAKSTLQSELQSELGAAKARVRAQTIGRVENMVHEARETMTSAGSTTIDTVKSNPIPAALVAVGLGWLIVSSLKTRSTYDPRIQARSFDGIDEDGYAYSYDQGVARANARAHGASPRRPRRVIERGRRVVEKVGSSVASTVSETAEHLAGDASSIAHDAGTRGRRIARRASTQARRAEQGFEHQLHDHPVAFGAVAVAIGAAIGLLLPRTETEDRLVGAKKDRLLDTAKERFEDVARQAIDSVQEKAGEITSSLKRADRPQNGISNGFAKHA